MELIVGTDSTWSLRAWICARLVEIELDLNVIDLTQPDYKSQILQYSPAGLVPALKHGDLITHDSLAIAEYFNDYSSGGLYPNSIEQRAKARSLCAEMHSGFISLRSECPFTLDAVEPMFHISECVKEELNRLTEIFEKASMPFMFECAGAVDAFYAILAYRLKTYGINLNGKAGDYQQSLLKWPLLIEAINEAVRWRALKGIPLVGSK